ncbi:unnamed protein product [Kluyveromyces dobzhanskii CBS 2104]|uniref:WGS project CCBQ000000000 data, contig 00106 n=1 Tax=Kluyveromyces dobzhanskii CBS 2104 TaxID=1427455 RepID=A0A0A8L5A7_9SACH|nr:unnamed protein product [Kluyveromyces dobzhanskii CBS 2104]
MSNPFKNVGRNFAYLCIGLTASVVIVKTMVRGEKMSKFNPQGDSENVKKDGSSYYLNPAGVKPGFPMKKEEDGTELKRKSEFEGAGLSYNTRKRGDKLGFFDRRNNE